MGLLGALGLGLVHAALRHRVRLAEPASDHVPCLTHGDAGDRGGVGSHVGDQTDVPIRRIRTFVQALGDRHRPLRAEAELAARLLLERRCRERRCRTPRHLPRADLRDDRLEIAQGGGMPLGGLTVRDVEGRAVDPDDLGRERRAVGGGEQRLERPVLAGRECVDLALALDDEPHRHGLHATGRQSGADLARQQRAERVADEPVDDPAGLLGVHEVGVDLAGIGERLADGPFRDLAERDPLSLRWPARAPPPRRARRSPHPRGRGRSRGRPCPRPSPPSRSRRPACGDRRRSRTRARSRGRRRRRTFPCRGSRGGRGRDRRRRGPGSRRRGSARSSAPWQATRRSRGSLARRGL